MVDKIIFHTPQTMMDKDIDFYLPKSGLDSNLRNMNIYIHDKNLISKLSIELGQKNINDEYISILREYHNQMLELYSLIYAKPVIMSIEKMGNNIKKSLEYTNSEKCLLINDSMETYDNLIKDFPQIMKALSQRPNAIRRIHQRIYNVKPEKNKNGEYNVDGMIERIEIIRDLMHDPYLAVRKDNTEALQEINQFLVNFDALHAIYVNCAESYNSKVQNITDIRDVVSFVIFIILTLLIYSKEILS